MTDNKESLQDEIGRAADLIAEQQAAEDKPKPKPKERGPLWLALSIVALVVAIWFERDTLAGVVIPPDEELAVMTAAVDDVRKVVEAYRDSTGSAPVSLDAIHLQYFPVAYRVDATKFHIAAGVTGRDSVRTEGPAARARQ